jgi:glycosyltransferase involved in cell wall biosynthesis
MRIIYLVSFIAHAAGGARVIIEHANRLARRGHTVRILVADSNLHPYFPSEVTVCGIENAPRETADALVVTDIGLLHIARAIKAEKKFVLIQHDLPLVTEAAGFKVQADGMRAVLKDLPRENYRVLCVSSWIGAGLKEGYGLDALLVRNGIDRGIFTPAKPLLETSAQTPRIMGIYDVQAWKGFNDAVGAVLRIRELYPAVGMIVLGQYLFNWPTSDGAMLCFQYPMYFFQKPLPEDIPRVYSSASVFVSSSWYEGFGLPGLEAMACGVPVVTTDSGGVREYAINEETALVVPPRDPRALADAVIRVLGDESLRRKLIKNGLAKAAEFDWEKSIDILEREFMK